MVDELNGDSFPFWEAIDQESERFVCSKDGTTVEHAKNIQVASRPVLIELYGLDDCHRFSLLRYIGCGDGDEWTEYRCGGCPVVLNAANYAALLFLPGRYKLQLIDCCDTEAADAITLVKTPLTKDQADLFMAQQCCCPHTEEVKPCGT